MESITLFFRQGASDKVYQASIAPRSGGYVVRFAYGRFIGISRGHDHLISQARLLR